MEINILYEDTHLIVCEKPAGVPAQSDKTMDFDMINGLKNHIHKTDPKNSNPYIGLIHRLDRPVGGIMVFAKTPFANRELSRQIQKKEMIKKYMAVVTGDLTNEIDSEPIQLTDYIVVNGRTNLSTIVSQKEATNNKSAKKAELTYQVLGIRQEVSIPNPSNQQDDLFPCSLVKIHLQTGRHHQIRVQMQQNRYGLWGDSKYNPLFQNKAGWYPIGLYAYSLSFCHPYNKKPLTFQLIPKEKPFDLFSELLEII